MLDDGTGKILVNPDKAAMNFEKETWTVESGEEPPAMFREYLERSDSSSSVASEVIYPVDRKFIHGQIGPGDDVYVYGPVKSGPAENAPDRTVRSYVGSDQSMQEQDDSGGGFSYGLARESDVFTVSNTGEQGAQRTLLWQAALFIGVGVVFVVIGVGVVFL